MTTSDHTGRYLDGSLQFERGEPLRKSRRPDRLRSPHQSGRNPGHPSPRHRDRGRASDQVRCQPDTDRQRRLPAQVRHRSDGLRPLRRFDHRTPLAGTRNEVGRQWQEARTTTTGRLSGRDVLTHELSEIVLLYDKFQRHLRPVQRTCSPRDLQRVKIDRAGIMRGDHPSRAVHTQEFQQNIAKL